MKNIKYILVLTGIFMFSCDESLTDINKDPNASPSATASGTFVSGTAFHAIALDAYFNVRDALFAQYLAGGPGVALLDDERYFFTAADYNTEWGLSYNQALTDLKFTIDNGNPALSAAAEVLSVHVWQNIVDHFGRVPYFDALKGDPSDGGILTPGYDEPKAIYDNLIVRLDAAIATLSNTEGIYNDADLAIGKEDLIYDLEDDEAQRAKWIAFANSLKLRILMRQSISDPSVGPAVISLIANGTFIEDEAGMAKVPFSGGDAQNYNPMFARHSSFQQFYVASLASVEKMEELNDPRLPILYDEATKTSTIVGLKQGDIANQGAVSSGDFSYPSSVQYAETNDVILMSHWEVMFLRAEADMRFNTSDDEEEMFNAAVTAHFDYVGAADAATYLTNVGYDASASPQTKSDMIGIQKWISMNGLQESEGWIESRRFDTAPTNVFTNTTNGIFYTPTRSVFAAGVFPTIRLYPQTELSTNPEAPPGRVTTEKVFWDN